jgi:biotin carboxyl carrier protein
MFYEILVGGRLYKLEVQRSGSGWSCRVDGQIFPVDAVSPRPGILSLFHDGRSYEARREQAPDGAFLWLNGTRYAAEARDPRSLRYRRSRTQTAGPKKLTASMPGKVIRLLVKERDPVEAGQAAVVVEAMKMQNELKSPKQGIVQKILVAEGTTVNAGDVLLIVE